LEGYRPSKQGFRRSPNRARVLFLFLFLNSDAGELDAKKEEYGVVEPNVCQGRLVEKKESVAADY
jgi:hypothetical protein